MRDNTGYNKKLVILVSGEMGQNTLRCEISFKVDKATVKTYFKPVNP